MLRVLHQNHLDEKTTPRIYHVILTLAALLHFVYAVIFYLLGAAAGAVYSLFGIAVYFFAKYAATRGRFAFAVAAAHLEVSLFVLLSVYLLGMDCGFQLLLICMAAFVYICPYPRWYTPYIYSTFEMGLFIGLILLIPPDYRGIGISEKAALALTVFNVLCTFSLILLSALLTNVSASRVRGRLIEENEGLTQANQGLTEQNQGLTEANRGLAEQNQGLTEANRGLAEQNQGLTEANRGLTEQNLGLTEANRGLTEQNQGLTEANRGLTEQNQGLTEANRGLTEQNLGLTEANRGLTEQNQGLTEANRGLTEQNHNLTEANRGLVEVNRDLTEQNRGLKDLAMLDSLTGLALRRIAEEEMDRHWREYLQSGLPFSTALIDIDDFKRVNDTYGHHGGDQVLLQLAVLMHQAQCSAYRWGGEEFLLLFPGLRKGDALPQTEALRQRVAQHRFRFLQTELTLSITIGLSDCTEVSVCSDAVNLADSRMYLGKRSGKNQVVWN